MIIIRRFFSLCILGNIFLCNAMTYFPQDDIDYFIATKETCGAALNEPGIETYRSINSAFLCMKTGLKKVYWGLEDELEHLTEESQELLKEGLIKKIALPRSFRNPSKFIIFYTTAGKKDAFLFAKLQKKRIKKIKRLEKKLQYIAMRILSNIVETIGDEDLDILKNIIFSIKSYASEAQQIEKSIETVEHTVNHYLNGILLGYAKKDIRYFYRKNNSESKFKNDKQEAKKWITKHKQNQ